MFTRPLGACFGDLLSQPADYGGFGLGLIVTSAIFLAAIIGIVIYMSAMRRSPHSRTAINDPDKSPDSIPGRASDGAPGASYFWSSVQIAV